MHSKEERNHLVRMKHLEYIRYIRAISEGRAPFSNNQDKGLKIFRGIFRADYEPNVLTKRRVPQIFKTIETVHSICFVAL